MLIDLIKRFLVLVFVPFQVAAAQDGRQEANRLPWDDPVDEFAAGTDGWENEPEYEEGFDLYGMADDNCSFDLFDEDETGWSEEDGF